jgi:pimeloyl-ACP methyl ester carboxylesterase
MTDVHRHDHAAEAEALAATFGGRTPDRRTRLSPVLEGAVEHRIPISSGHVAAWRVGEGPAVLLAHGFSDSQALWTPLMRALLAAHRPFVAFDLPGHGRSGESNRRASDGIEALFAVSAALGPIQAVVAHSMSVTSTLVALAEGLPCQRAVMLASATQFQRQFARLRAPPDMRPHVIARAREILEARDPPDPRFDLAAAAANMTIPALFIHCHDDVSWSSAASAHLAAHWKGAESRFTQALGHRGVARDAVTVRWIVEFLERR